MKLHTLLISELDGSERLISHIRHFNSGEKILYLRNRRVGGAAVSFNAR
jgi:hypothetical protein